MRPDTLRANLSRRGVPAGARSGSSVQPAGSRKAVMARSSSAQSEVTIRRYPPGGKDKQSAGSLLQFEIPAEDDEKPRNILEEIVWFKNEEIARHREKMDLASLKRKIGFVQPARDFIGAIKAKYEETGKPGLIAECKRASPSKGIIKEDFDPVDIALEYEAGGAACISVLTDEKYFKGSFDNLELIRGAGLGCPLLCKEFIVEAYQIFHARAKGADAILLIAAVLPNADLSYLIKCARSLGMASLVEVHSEVEMQRVLELEEVELIGINNRDLETFQVDLYNTERVLDEDTKRRLRERDIICVGESGIFTPEDVKVVQDAGCRSVLVGESLVKEEDIEGAVKKLLS